MKEIEIKQGLQEEEPKRRKIIIKRKKVKKVKKKSSSDKEKKQIEELKQQFLQEMDDKTKQAYEIAQHHLESSFDLDKCLAFQTFIHKKLKK